MTDDATLEAESARIEQLLTDLRELVMAPVWQRIEDVLRRVVALYGAGLAHTLEHARAAGASSDVLDARIAGDDLVASLLVLHGLHPHSTEDRILATLRRIEIELGIAENTLALAAIHDGVVELTAAAELGGAMASRVAEGVIRKVVETAAPEVGSVQIRGPDARRDPSLYQIRIRRQATP